MSNVVVLYNQRRVTIKTTPGKSLSDIRTEACSKFALSSHSNYILKRGATKLDLSLPVRLSGLAPGAKLELVKSSSSSAAINVVLRTVDPVEQLSGVFPPNTSVWSILRKFEQDAKAAGRGNVNITERCLPSAAGNGSGRLLYQMPAVRVANRELANFDELRKSLEDLGCSGRELLVLRFLPTEVPYEDALMEIAGAPVHHSGAETQKVDLAETAPATEDVEMSNTSDTPGGPAESAESTESRDAPSDETAPSLPEEPAVPDVPKFAVYQPSSSQVPAAAALEVPDSAYDIGISDLKRIKQNYHNASLPQRLPSNKEIEEKEAILRQEMEKINTLKIKVRFPDGYISHQELDGKNTAQDLYKLIRGTLRYPSEPFVLMIPPRETIKDNTRRLTIDLKLRSGASLHLAWSKEASDKAKSEPALNDELLKASKELPKPVLLMGTDTTDIARDEDPEKGKGKQKEKSKGDFEKKLKGFLGLSKK